MRAVPPVKIGQIDVMQRISCHRKVAWIEAMLKYARQFHLSIVTAKKNFVNRFAGFYMPRNWLNLSGAPIIVP